MQYQAGECWCSLPHTLSLLATLMAPSLLLALVALRVRVKFGFGGAEDIERGRLCKRCRWGWGLRCCSFASAAAAAAPEELADTRVGWVCDRAMAGGWMAARFLARMRFAIAVAKGHVRGLGDGGGWEEDTDGHLQVIVRRKADAVGSAGPYFQCSGWALRKDSVTTG